MNKTINVNIGGRIFSIEEDAYAKLEKYLKAIRGFFEGHQSADEIISDIELRISELFSERIDATKQVIVIDDVEAVISIMGRPEDYIDIDEDEEEPAFSNNSKKKYEKRVFRDPDNKLLFGVCSGLSAYLGWDPIVLRALFVIFTITWGIGPLIYIILALIIPKAKTTAEKLQMRGEPVTVENISKKVNESFEGIKDDVKDFGERNSETVNNAGKQIGDIFNDFFEAVGKVLKVLIVILGKIFGVIFLIAGAAGITGLIAALLGWDAWFTAGSSQDFNHLLDASFSSSGQRFLFFSGLTLAMGIPALAFILLGIRLLFSSIRYSGMIAVGLIVGWFVGIGFLTASGVHAARDIRVGAEYTEDLKIGIEQSVDTLVLDIEGADLPRYEFSDDFMDGAIFFEGDVTIPGVDSTNVMYMGRNEITIRQAMNQNYVLEMERSARGSSHKDAIKNARDIETSWTVQNDSLRLSPYFYLNKGSKIRGQQSEFTLFVPVGKAVRFAPRSEEIIYDIPNVTNTYDRDMIGKTWLMTKDGLECTTCDFEEINEEEEPEWEDWKEREEELLREREELEKRMQELEEASSEIS